MLAFACAFTMFAGAAFTDQADIETAEAVDTLVALGVIDGYDDGSFQPDKTVTRAEMAKMIYIIRTGRSDASAYNDDATTFTDITDHWAEGFIKYCQSLGIISGKSATRFDPDATVTTQEAAKMLLVTLGYNAERAGLEGTGWGQKTTALADENGLLEDVLCGTTQGMPRQYAAQLIYNAVFAPTVVYRDGEYTNILMITSDEQYYNPTIGEKFMGLISVEGYMDGASYNSVKKEYTYSIDPDALDTADDADSTSIVSTNDLSALFGQKVKALYKVEDNKRIAYGMYELSDSVTATVGELDLTTANDDKIKLADVEYKLDGNDTAINVYNYVSGNVVDTNYNLNAITADEASALTLVDDDNDGKYDYAVVTPASVEKVTYAGTTSITAGSSYKFEDHNIYEGVAKDDFALIIAAANNVYDKAQITKVETVEGEVTALKGSQVELDGSTWYKQDANANTVPSVGETVELAVVGGYYYNVEVISGKTLDNVLMILDAGMLTGYGVGKGAEAEVMYANDGRTATVKISKVDVKDNNGMKDVAAVGNYTTQANIAEGGMYTFVEKDGALELTVLANDVISNYDFDGTIAAGGTGAYDDTGLNGKDPAVGSYAIADDAVVMVGLNSTSKYDYTMITGATLKSVDGYWGGKAQVLYNTVNGVKTAQVIALYSTGAGTLPVQSGDTSYGYVISESYYTESGDDKYAVMTIWTADGELTNVKAEGYGAGNTTPTRSAMTSAPFAKGSFVSFKTLANGNIDTVTAITTGYDAITGIYSNKDGDTALNLVNDANKYAVVDEDTKVIYIDAENTAGAEGGEIQEARETENLGEYVENVLVYDAAAADDKLEAIFVDVNGDINNDTKAQSAVNAGEISSALAAGPVTIDESQAPADMSGITISGGQSMTINGKLNVTDISKLPNVSGGTFAVEEIDISTNNNLTAAQVNNLLSYTDQLTIGNMPAGGDISVGANQTLTIDESVASLTQNAVLKVDKDAAVVFETGFVFGKADDAVAFSNGELTLTVNSSNGWKITAEVGTELTVNRDVRIGSETNNFYTGAAAASATKVSSPVKAGTYTYTSGLTAGGSDTGWFMQTTE